MLNFSKKKNYQQKEQQQFVCDDPRDLWEATKNVIEYRKKITPIKDDEEYIELFEKMEDLMDKEILSDSEVEEVEILQDRLLKYDKSFSTVTREHHSRWHDKWNGPRDDEDGWRIVSFIILSLQELPVAMLNSVIGELQEKGSVDVDSLEFTVLHSKKLIDSNGTPHEVELLPFALKFVVNKKVNESGSNRDGSNSSSECVDSSVKSNDSSIIEGSNTNCHSSSE